MNSTLKPYQAFDQSWDTDRSVLIFAKDQKQAMELALSSAKMGSINRDRLAVVHLTKHEFLNDKYKPEEPCVIEEPETCRSCGQWTQEIGADGFCGNCERELQNGFIG